MILNTGKHLISVFTTDIDLMNAIANRISEIEIKKDKEPIRYVESALKGIGELNVMPEYGTIKVITENSSAIVHLDYSEMAIRKLTYCVSSYLYTCETLDYKKVILLEKSGFFAEKVFTGFKCEEEYEISEIERAFEEYAETLRYNKIREIITHYVASILTLAYFEGMNGTLVIRVSFWKNKENKYLQDAFRLLPIK